MGGSEEQIAWAIGAKSSCWRVLGSYAQQDAPPPLGIAQAQYLASVNQSPRAPTTKVGMECPPGPVELLGAHHPDR
jgi:hypothetical protein